ncbi:hypothetical protein FXW26_01280 [Candidatus Liberibacter asiaticus]|nr:hypothetical protein FXW26_01280 [Candidatus Liberibacter asiaticus]
MVERHLGSMIFSDMNKNILNKIAKNKTGFISVMRDVPVLSIINSSVFRFMEVRTLVVSIAKQKGVTIGSTVGMR